MAILNLLIDTNDTDTFSVPGSPVETAGNLSNLLKSMEMGARLKPSTLGLQVAPISATGTLTLSGAAGTVGGTINGVAITVTAAGGDTASAVLLAAAINASVNALVAGIVTATSALGVVTITSVVKGIVGNSIALTASGTGVTASGARLTAGTNGTASSFIF